MKIQKKDSYHGAALTQVVEHDSFKALNKADHRYGHYQVNRNRRLLVKYRASEGERWTFTFPEAETLLLKSDLTRQPGRTFVCLVCGTETVCLLDESQIATVLDLGDASQQTITVTCPKNCSLRVWGSAGALDQTVPHNAFPGKIFE